MVGVVKPRAMNGEVLSRSNVRQTKCCAIRFSLIARYRWVSISHAQRKPLPSMNWVVTIYHGLPRDLLRFNPTASKHLNPAEATTAHREFYLFERVGKNSQQCHCP
jgi:hypothetical protein